MSVLVSLYPLQFLSADFLPDVLITYLSLGLVQYQQFEVAQQQHL